MQQIYASAKLQKKENKINKICWKVENNFSMCQWKCFDCMGLWWHCFVSFANCWKIIALYSNCNSSFGEPSFFFFSHWVAWCFVVVSPSTCLSHPCNYFWEQNSWFANIPLDFGSVYTSAWIYTFISSLRPISLFLSRSLAASPFRSLFLVFSRSLIIKCTVSENCKEIDGNGKKTECISMHTNAKMITNKTLAIDIKMFS